MHETGSSPAQSKPSYPDITATPTEWAAVQVQWDGKQDVVDENYTSTGKATL